MEKQCVHCATLTHYPDALKSISIVLFGQGFFPELFIPFKDNIHSGIAVNLKNSHLKWLRHCLSSHLAGGEVTMFHFFLRSRNFGVCS